MSTSRMARIDASMERLDSILDQRLQREEQALAADNAEREASRRQRQRDNAEQRRMIATAYDDAFRSFGTAVPEPADDESPSAYRRRLYNRLARKLPSGHELAEVRADDISGQQIVFDNFERMLLDAAKAEGEHPSFANLPPSGELISRTRTDHATGEKSIEYFGRESFIKDLSRPAHRVVAVLDPKSQNVLWGKPLDRVR
jgi:hypothetical protein